jgi:hypothetical protein
MPHENEPELDAEDRSLLALLGFAEERCPVCQAHLKRTEAGDLICLNACHLGPAGQRRFLDHLERVMAAHWGREQTDAE